MLALLEKLGLPVWVLPVAGLLIGLAGALVVTRWYYRAEIASILEADAAAAVKAVELARIQDDKFNQLARDAERQHNEDSKKTADLYDANLALARNGVRFKAAGRCLPKGSTASGDTVDGTAEVRLPDATVADLLRLARDADDTANYSAACHAWAKSLTQP